MDDGEIIDYQGWTLHVRRPQGGGSHQVVWFVHGWTGDENVMWIFSPRIPKNSLLIAPRGIFPAPQGGYGWYPHRDGVWPVVRDFQPGIDRLVALMDLVKDDRSGIFGEGNIDISQNGLVGFSQGAALVYTLSLLNPERVQRMAGLAGFLPADAEKLAVSRPLMGKKVYAAHGMQDERVPVEQARAAVRVLESAGASVVYCEDNVGHKLSANCMRGLGEFFR
jgi:phospholipase/carboxylesterase